MIAKGILPADILLPKVSEIEKWSVIACDQFTSQKNYWDRVEENVGGAPSALRLILPESALGSDNLPEVIGAINSKMEEYYNGGLFEEYKQSVFYIEREQSNGKYRRGIICNIDLEEYDYTDNASALIRATEKTVVERIPPRMAIRENALLELPHIMLFIDDGENRVIDKLSKQKSQMEKLYGFELMEGGGRIDGWRLESELADKLFEAVGEMEKNVNMLYAIGDGNHSLAAAKAVYEKQKAELGEKKGRNLPSRYALVEVVSLHDEAIPFEPIHRVVYDADCKKLLGELAPLTENGSGNETVVWKTKDGSGSFVLKNSADVLTARTLQNFLDCYTAKNGGRIDYVHGSEVLDELCMQDNTITFELPPIEKSRLFSMVTRNGSLPRKTFSVGCAADKRYYLECRTIR